MIVALLLVALTAGASQAQVGVYRSGGAIKKEKKEHREKREQEEQEHQVMERKQREYIRNLEWTNSIVLNYSLTFLGGTSNVGLTYARCKTGGFYVNLMSGLEWHTANVDRLATEYYNTNNGLTSYEYYGTTQRSHPRISITVGGVIRIAKPVFVYAGAGYSYRGLNYKTVDGNWAKYPKGDGYNLGNCADLEIGIIGTIKGFTLQFGYSILLSESSCHANEIKVGIGYSFNSKKQKQEQKQEQKEAIENE